MRFDVKQFLIYRLPAIAWAVLLFFLSSIPSRSLPKFVINVRDLFLHFIFYSVFGLLLSHAMIERPERASRWSRWLVVGIGVLYGASDELHQSFVPGRACSFLDFLADSAGVTVGLFLYFFLVRRLWFERKSRNELS